MSVNKVILVGNLGADPEIRTTPNGKMIANIRLATTHWGRGPDGTNGKQTEWHRVTVIGRSAETVERFCKKGKQIYVEGHIETRKWTDNNGQDRWSTEIVSFGVTLLGGRADGDGGGGYGGGGGGGYGGGGRQSYNSSQVDSGPSIPDDEIPF